MQYSQWLQRRKIANTGDFCPEIIEIKSPLITEELRHVSMLMLHSPVVRVWADGPSWPSRYPLPGGEFSHP